MTVATIILWNTVYLERAIAALRQHGIAIEDDDLAHFSPMRAKYGETIPIHDQESFTATDMLPHYARIPPSR
jgi:Tn3 transposase DDE domain